MYPAFDQLTALGYIRSAQNGMRPWTRAECARLVAEAEEAVDVNAHDLSAETVYVLAREFAPELGSVETEPNTRIEEVYARTDFMSGQPLTDDFHFAKTITDDFGRPFGQGVNAVTGVAARTVAGPLAFYFRAEYQHAGALPAFPVAAQNAITSLEGLPFAPSQRTDSDRFRFLDTYVSFNLHNNVISFGKQTLWWGPGADGPFLESNNAEPILMLRVSRATPFVLPWLFRLMGPIRVEAFWGQLEGQQFVGLLDAAGNRGVITSPLHPHPVIQGAKFSFRPTQNLEFGFDETAIFSGPGFPLTLHSLLRSYSPANTIPGLSTDPGIADRPLIFPIACQDCASGLRSTPTRLPRMSFRPLVFRVNPRSVPGCMRRGFQKFLEPTYASKASTPTFPTSVFPASNILMAII